MEIIVVGIMIYWIIRICLIIQCYYKVSDFLKNICQGRDSSHGYKHGVQVMWWTLWIYFRNLLRGEMVINFSILKLLCVVGLLHDVDDAKYDKDGTLKMRLENYLENEFGKKEKKIIINIIHRISHSKEIDMRKNCNGCVDWIDVLGIEGIVVRNCVSDADKLDSLGKNGHERSKKFNSNKLKNGEGENKLYEYVDWIIENKLKSLDQYFYTSYGKELSVGKIKELLLVHSEWKKKLGI